MKTGTPVNHSIDLFTENNSATVKRAFGNNTSSAFKPNLNKEQMSKAREDILNMNDDQLNNMFNMMKNMDNATFKNMMKMQGMDISDDQLNMVKNSMNPDMFRMMAKNSDKFDNLPTPTKTNSLDNENVPPQTTKPTTTQQQPFNMPQNMDMSSMMSFIQNNPQLLNMMGPQFSQMFGNNDPHMMKAIQNIMWLMSMPQRIKAFFSTTNGKMLILVIIVLIIAYFYR